MGFKMHAALCISEQVGTNSWDNNHCEICNAKWKRRNKIIIIVILLITCVALTSFRICRTLRVFKLTFLKYKATAATG